MIKNQDPTGAYLNAEISLAQAAALLGMHPLELRKRFVDKGIPLLLGPADEADAQSEIDAMRAWRQTAKASEPH